MTAVSTDEFKDALKNFASGVTIVTTSDADGRPVGATVSSFASLSLEPPLIVVCLTRASRSAAAIRESGAFAVHFLGAGQTALARRFALDLAEKFEDVSYSRGPAGVPRLEDCPVRLECRLQSEHPEGDHVMFVGLVEATWGTDQFEPLVYSRRSFFALGTAVE